MLVPGKFTVFSHMIYGFSRGLPIIIKRSQNFLTSQKFLMPAQSDVENSAGKNQRGKCGKGQKNKMRGAKNESNGLRRVLESGAIDR